MNSTLTLYNTSKIKLSMEILAFVDAHGSLSALRELKKKAARADLLVCAGDISIFEHGLVRLLYELNKINKPVLIIHGNHETEEILKKSSWIFGME